MNTTTSASSLESDDLCSSLWHSPFYWLAYYYLQSYYNNLNIIFILITFKRLQIDGLFLYNDILYQNSVVDTVMNFFVGLVETFFTFSLILFATCCYAAASTLHSIQREINRFDLIKMSPLCALNRLRKWRRCHQLVSDIVDTIGDCFAPTLFLSVNILLIRLIHELVFADCFCLIFHYVAVINYTFFVQSVYILSLICFSVDHLQVKVIIA